MSADQRKRRPSTTTVPFGHGITEQYRAKKRDFRSVQYEFNHNSHVSLKWDDNENSVIAKEDQIGISSRHLGQFGPVSNAKLVDVVAVPKEVFLLDDLKEVLTYENWQSLLTEKDRITLAQLLPRGFDSNEVVQALLGCENFHFGNPLLKWGSSLCSGDLHPDAVVQYEKFFKANKKAYYSELQQYHDNMIRNLQKLKERCGSSKDPESEILKIMSRSKGPAEKSAVPDSNGFSTQKHEANAMYESTPSFADDKSYYSDNQKLSVIRDAEVQRRNRNQELTKDKPEKSSSSPNGIKRLPKPKKAEKSQKANITSNDGSKYMSYVKISKKQHEELVLSMGQGQSGPVIQPKNLNRLLGNLNSYNVKPYVMFEEEEQKRIHEHWTNLVNIDLPEALEKWKLVQLERLQIMGFLCQELEDKLGISMETPKENLVKPFDEEIVDAQDVDGDSRDIFKDHHDNRSTMQGSISNDEKPTHCSSENGTSKQCLPLNINQEIDPSSLQNPLRVKEEFESSTKNQPLKRPLLNVEKESDPSSIRNQPLRISPLIVNEELGSSSMETKSLMEMKPLMENPPLIDNQGFDPVDLKAENHQVSSKTHDTCSLPEQYVSRTTDASLFVSNTKTHDSSDGVVEVPHSSINNVWSPINLPESYGHAQQSTCGIPFLSTSEPTVRHPHLVSEQPSHVIDLDPDLPGGPTKDLLNRHTNHLPFLAPYANRETNELQLQSLIQLDRFHHEQLQSRTVFHPGSALLEPNHELQKTRSVFHPGGTLLDPNPEQQNTRTVFHPANALLEPNQFPGHAHDPSFAVDHKQRAQSGLFMNQNIHDSIYSDSNRYSIPVPEPFSNLNVKDWGGPRMSAPIQSQLNHTWFTNDNRAHIGWSTPEGTVFSTTGLGSGSSDQSLYSVLSQYNSLQPRPQYNPVGLSEQMMIPSTSYGIDVAPGIPMTSNPSPPQTVSQFNYLSGDEASVTSSKNPVMSWMGLGHQPSALQDPSGRPLLKPWDQ